MSRVEKVTLPIINFSRRHFRNTWVHRIPLTSWVYHQVFKYTYRDEPEKEIIFRGAKYIVPTLDTAVVPSMMSGDYEHFELELFKKILKEGDVVLDIGANIGVYCIEASRIIGRMGVVYAFEPIADNIKLLTKNLQMNSISNVTLLPFAIGEKVGRIKIYKVENSIATHTAGAISDNYEDVSVETIDHFIEEKKLSIDLIKMDIEGYEGFAIEGGLKTLKKQQPKLFIEFSTHHLKQCKYSPEVHAKNLLSMYKHCYLINEKSRSVSEVNSVAKLSKLYNANLIFSPTPIDFKSIQGLV